MFLLLSTLCQSPLFLPVNICSPLIRTRSLPLWNVCARDKLRARRRRRPPTGSVRNLEVFLVPSPLGRNDRISCSFHKSRGTTNKNNTIGNGFSVLRALFFFLSLCPARLRTHASTRRGGKKGCEASRDGLPPHSGHTTMPDDVGVEKCSLKAHCTVFFVDTLFFCSP